MTKPITSYDGVRERRAHLFKHDETNWANLIRVLKIEDQFGRILFLPIDIEPIVPDDVDKFRSWFFDRAKGIEKYSRTYGLMWEPGTVPFDAVNTLGYTDVVYEQNKQDIHKEFPELKKKLSQLPYRILPEYKVWSSTIAVSPHRDNSYAIDLPCNFRSMLFDDNPESTLFVQEDWGTGRGTKVRTPRCSTFAWNNFRAEHSTEFDPKYRKAILIPGAGQFDPVKLKMLLQRSLKKFESEIIFSVQSEPDRQAPGDSESQRTAS